MTQQLAVFNYHGLTVRTIDVDGELFFVAGDVAEVLGYSTNPSRLFSHVPDDWKGVHPIHTPGGKQEMLTLSEPGLFFFLNRSDKPAALPMQKWVAGEVLPSIRKTGGYSMQPQELIARAVIEAQKLIDHQTALIAEMKPKADFFDTVTGSSDAVDIGTVAKVLNCGIGRTRLFSFLRDKSILQDNNQPYQRYIDAGYFRVIESTYNKPDGSTHVSFKTVVYQKGVDYIRKRLAKSIESGEFKEAA